MGHAAAQFVRFSSNSDQVDASRSELSLCAKTGLMHRNKNRHFYSITSSVRASSMGGMVSLRPYAYGCALMSPRPSAQLKSIAVHLVPAH
jgi:hypothetical protein